jgi:hypothetical protein
MRSRPRPPASSARMLVRMTSCPTVQRAHPWLHQTIHPGITQRSCSRREPTRPRVADARSANLRPVACGAWAARPIPTSATPRSTHGVVLVRERSAEERHDAIAPDLVHRALVAVDGLHHPLKDWIENLAPLLGITVGQQLQRALQVGEEAVCARPQVLLWTSGSSRRGAWVCSCQETAAACPLRQQRDARRSGRTWPSLRGPSRSSSRSGPAGSRTLRRSAPLRVVVLAPGTLHCRASSPLSRAPGRPTLLISP